MNKTGQGKLFDRKDGRRLEIDGADIYYEIRGDEAGAPIVFLHGGFGAIEDFNPVLPELSRTHRLIGIDSRGHGGSTLGSGKLTYRRLAEDAAAVIRHLGLDAVTVVGHSDGGIAALRLAAEKAVNVERLVVIGSHWALADDDPVRGIYREVTPESWREMFPQSYDAYHALNPAPDFERLTSSLLEMWLDSGEDGYPGEKVRDIGCPLLVVRGDEDILVSRASAVELADRVADAKLMNLPFAGHSAHEEQAGIFLWALKAFLKPEDPPQEG